MFDFKKTNAQEADLLPLNVKQFHSFSTIFHYLLHQLSAAVSIS